MRLITFLGIVLLTVAFVEPGVVHREIYDDDTSTIVPDTDRFYQEDEDGNLREITDDEDDDESLTQTKSILPERVFFHLYTKANRESSQEIYIGDDDALANSNWDSKRPTRIITHGWINSYKSIICTKIRDAYQAEGDYNLILVDWSTITYRLYGFARRRVCMVGEYIAEMIDYLETKGMNVTELIVIGHSLGGHVAGLAARHATKTVGYVIALDPALPFFWFSGPENRLSRNDAAYVQVIHTSAGLLGFEEAIGDIDFYPNGGSSQNGCILDAVKICAHARSWMYFAESIVSKVGFHGRLCESWKMFKKGRCTSTTTTYMGGSTPTTETKSGSYYLETGSSSTYALGVI
ncbi:pancreatic triacylglycerol lipase-like [Neodiprion virginianus]|uniref:pancreatic triacylglycerol lipase-like n=1 Tax=Neodiprion virginianus TaxID=2961670 RepID=UPI001EE6D2F3|nr:pancreatic triacylglycerol lipase-like [Neodiprion virginianus]